MRAYCVYSNALTVKLEICMYPVLCQVEVPRLPPWNGAVFGQEALPMQLCCSRCPGRFGSFCAAWAQWMGSGSDRAISALVPHPVLQSPPSDLPRWDDEGPKSQELCFALAARLLKLPHTHCKAVPVASSLKCKAQWFGLCSQNFPKWTQRKSSYTNFI